MQHTIEARLIRLISNGSVCVIAGRLASALGVQVGPSLLAIRCKMNH